MELDARFVLRGLGSRLVEVEYQAAPRELERVAIFQEIEERPGLLSDHGLHQAVPKTSIEIEIEKGGKLACLEQAVRAIGRRAPRVEVHPEDALALVQLLDHALLELAVAAQAEVLGIALHLDQVAGHRPPGEIEIEQGEVGPAHRHFVADRVRLVHGGVEQVHVGIERDDDLVAQGPLVFQEQPRQRHAKGFGPRRRRGNELERQAPGERAELIEDDDGAPVGVETVIPQHGSQDRLQLGE